MEFLSESFLVAFAGIVVIDLLLAGDNAVVLSLASGTVAAARRRRFMLQAVAGAVAVRAMAAVAVIPFLAIPGMLLFSGAALLWIAYRLLVPRQLRHSRE